MVFINTFVHSPAFIIICLNEDDNLHYLWFHSLGLEISYVLKLKENHFKCILPLCIHAISPFNRQASLHTFSVSSAPSSQSFLESHTKSWLKHLFSFGHFQRPEFLQISKKEFKHKCLKFVLQWKDLNIVTNISIHREYLQYKIS